MILSMSNQAVVFLMTIILGFVIGFIYDLFRVFRKLVQHPNFLIQLEDIIYWLFVSLLMFYFMLNKNYGEIRAFSIFGALIGMLLYFLTISKYFMKVSMIIADFLKKVLMTIVKIVLTPFRLLYNLLKIPAHYCNKKATKTFKSAKKVLHNSRKYAKIRGNKVYKQMKIIAKKV